MLKVQLPGSESAHSSLLLPKPFLSGHGNVTLAIRPRSDLYQKHNKSCSIRSRLPPITNPVPKKTTTELPFSRESFPPEFFFGTASSAYQYEGAASEDGKTKSVWDHFSHTYPEKISDGSNGDVALDSYHRYKEDVNIMKELGTNAYRISISWTRILPSGKVSGGVNQKGVDFYKKLINELLSQGIEPYVTIYHWDLPQALEDEYGGFLSPRVVDDFKGYAEVCYREFGDRVKYWTTLNEPWSYTVGGYVEGIYPPGKTSNAGTDPYTVAHHLLLCHAAAVRIYREKYQATQKGKIGITLNPFWMVPYSDTPADYRAAKRALDFTFGWFMEPVSTGEYPQCMQDLVGQRLPKFNKEQSEMLKKSYDFVGVNYYTSMYAQDAIPSDTPSYLKDTCCNLTSYREGVAIGTSTNASWLFICPQGLRDILIYTKERYNNPCIYVTENGVSQDSKLSMEEAIKDKERTSSLRDHLNYLLVAIEAGVNVRGFFFWTLFDDFEWDGGFTYCFGIYYVDRKNGLKRYPKESALWFKKFLKGE